MEIKLILEHHTPAVLDKLKEEIARGNREISSLQYQLRQIEIKYGAEVQFNNALCDLLRENGISFKDILNHDVRFKYESKR